MKRLHGLFVLLSALVAFGLSPLSGQSSDSDPALGVARLSLTNGDVSTRRGDSGDWIEANVNMPLVEGDSVATGPGSRAELQLDYSNFVRLNQNTEVIVGGLGSRSFRVQVARGIVTYSELRGGEADVDIETPHVAVRPEKNGIYRVEVFGDETVVTVRKGQAEVASPEGREKVESGRMMVVRGSGDAAEFRQARADPEDDWDQWSKRRDSQLAKSDSYRYVSRSIYGAEDLDDNGSWRYVSGYGNCWFPSVQAGWAPYRDGRWVWLDYYGWSWVGYEPWGWAPYHYGRWHHHTAFGWGWYPGNHYQRYHWSPALVAFFGYGHGNLSVGVGFGYGSIGWIPLAPFERYHPWYGGRFGHGFGRGGRHNNTTIYVDNSVNIYNNYRNARHSGATVVDAQGFSRGLVNNPRTLRSTELQRATLMRGQIPVVPARESQGRIVRASNQTGSAALGQNGARRNSSFFSRQAGQQGAARVPFEQQRQRMETSVRAFSETQGRRVNGAAAGARAGVGGQPAVSTANSAGGVRSAGGSTGGTARGASPASRETPGVSSAGLQSARSRSATESTGWRRLSPDRSAAAAGARTGAEPSSAAQSVRARGSDSAADSANVNRQPLTRWQRFGAGSATQRDNTRLAAPRTRSQAPSTAERPSARAVAPSSNSSGRVSPSVSSRSRTEASVPRSGNDRGRFLPRENSRVPAQSSSRVGTAGSAPISSRSRGESPISRVGGDRGSVAPRSSSRINDRVAPQSGRSVDSRPSAPPSRGIERGGGSSPVIRSRSSAPRPSGGFSGSASAPARTRGGGGSSIGRSSGPSTSRSAPAASSGSSRSGGGARSSGRGGRR